MANVMDYLVWRGDLGWEASEFNEVDNLILSELVYVDFWDIVPPPGQGEISLQEAAEIFFDRHTEEEINARVSSTKMAAFLMQEMAKTRRFGNIRLSDYVSDINLDEQSQFGAMTVQLGDGYVCVVYSGTDGTIVGWKEDFNMSFLSETPGQLKAVAYLERISQQYPLPIRIMGHSKGGNLSVYAATHCERALMERIEAIYNNDGPGFTETMIEQDNYSRMIPKIYTIVPESSIIGMLFEHEEEYEVVASSGSGVRQHDVMSWEVQGPSLVHLSSVDSRSVLLDKTFKSWIGKMENKQREEFVDTLFGILEEADIRTVDDLAGMNPTKFMELIRLRYSSDKESQEFMRETFRKLLAEGGKTLKETLFHK